MIRTAEYDEIFLRFLTALGRLNYTYTNTESLLIHLMAGLLGCDKEAATIVFLTLNTTRARLELVERLAKSGRLEAAPRDRMLSVTRDLARAGPLRNRFNHCIYAFDSESGRARSILMRIADRGETLKIGQELEIDDKTLHEVDAAIADLLDVNARIRRIVVESGYPA